eukprot:COSAG01_NODE_27620_length_681_cov_0.798969_2_plen_73_part_01
MLLGFVEKKVVDDKDCKVLINDDESKSPSVPSGSNLLTTLSDQGIFLPSACGGGIRNEDSISKLFDLGINYCI